MKDVWTTSWKMMLGVTDIKKDILEKLSNVRKGISAKTNMRARLMGTVEQMNNS